MGVRVLGVSRDTEGGDEWGACGHPALFLRSKFLWLHCFFSFFYFIINVLFMAHHCLSFLPRKSYKVSK